MKKKLITLSLSAVAVLYLLAQTPPAAKASAERGKKVYEQYCLTCHQVDGSGVPNLNPPLIKTSYVLGDKTKMVQVILKGMLSTTPIDDDYYSNNMPPHNFLKDQEIADVLTYVRSNFGNKASAVTAAEVKAIRAKKK